MKSVNPLNQPGQLYEPHLVIRELTLSSGKEWLPKTSGWLLVQIGSGSGYWLQDQSRTELEAGTVLLLNGDQPGRILASQLNVMSLFCFSMIPDRLSGLMTLDEQNFLKQAATRKELAFQIFTAQHSIALKMGELCARQNRGGFSARLTMLQLVVAAFGKELNQSTSSHENTDATQRLRLFLKTNPQDALLEISFDELARTTSCTARHLSRIFLEVAGMSFRDKRAEIRLARARELLATSESKVVEVAMESGFKSLSLFNLMFTRRFGISPGRWRKKNGADGRNQGRRKTKSPWPAMRKTRRIII